MRSIDPPGAAPDAQILYPVQYARGFAALAVFYYHISATVASTFEDAGVTVDAVGAAGVDLFFVISGFVITMLVARTRDFDAVAFMTARLWRIAPLYWLLTLLVFAVANAWPGMTSGVAAEPNRLLHSLAFLPYGAAESPSPVLLVGWTLNYEMFFYALVALGVAGFGEHGLKVVCVAICGLAAIGWLWPATNGYAAFYTDPIMLEFVLGIGCFYIWRATLPVARSPVWSVLALSGLVVLLSQFERDAGQARALFWGVPAAMLLLGSLHAVTWRSQALRRLGDLSYALYLVHLFVVIAVVRFVIPDFFIENTPWWVHYATMTAAVFAISYAVHLLVERPLARLHPRSVVALFARRGLGSAP